MGESKRKHLAAIWFYEIRCTIEKHVLICCMWLAKGACLSCFLVDTAIMTRFYTIDELDNVTEWYKITGLYDSKRVAIMTGIKPL